MNENINLVKILNLVPKGTILWSPIWGAVTFEGIDETDPRPIQCRKQNDGNFSIRADGRLTFYKDAECILFPSKENRDWNSFKVPSHKHFKPFQKVLVNVFDADLNYMWACNIYSHYDMANGRHYTVDGSWTTDDSTIVPYDGNEKLLGTIVE